MIAVELTQGQYAFIDDEDWPLVSQHTWHAQRDYSRQHAWYALASIPKQDGSGRQTSISMHALIASPDNGLVVDHTNGFGLDNRRCNLRAVRPAENAQNLPQPSTRNTSGETGVYWRKDTKKWRAGVGIGRQIKWLGTFNTYEEAVEAARAGRLQYHPNSHLTTEAPPIAKLCDANRVMQKLPVTKSNTSGFRGVCKRPYGWESNVTVGGRQHYLGTYQTAEEAHAAYCAARQDQEHRGAAA